MACMDTKTSTVEQSMIRRAKEKKIPINGSLELLPLCNMKCSMCYVRLDRDEMGQQGRLRTADEWIAVAEQMRKAGVLFLLLTGGEPLLFPNFKQLYLKLRKMGFILTLNTNGTLINEEWAAFFGKYVPRRINITLYGADEQEYKRLCHYPEGFERTIQAIRLLRKEKVDVKISCSITKENRQSLTRMFEIGKQLDVPVHIDPYMMPVVRERKSSFAEGVRVTPEDAASASMESLKLQFPEEIIEQYVAQTIERVEDPNFPRGDAHISCLAGNCSFTINWQGKMRPCVVMLEPSVSVFEKGFSESWKEICSSVGKIRISSKCIKCKYKPICKICAAASLSETGDYAGIPDYLCRFSEEYYRLVQAEKTVH